jgi:hypothetical protein
MGKFYSATIIEDNPTLRGTRLANWFSQFEGITVELYDFELTQNEHYIGPKITVDGTDIEIFLGIHPNATTWSYVWVKNNIIPEGATRLEYKAAGGGYNFGVVATAYIDENCIVLSACQNFNGFEVIIPKTSNDKRLLGYGRIGIGNISGTNYFLDASSLTYEEITDTARVPYKYINMFPYNAEAGTIDYTVGGIFVDGAQFKHFKSEALVECSTVSLLTTQSLIIGNCIALGTHCLAPLDMEEEEESE